MKKITNILAWVFIAIGMFLSIIVLVAIGREGKISIGALDWTYAKKVNDITGILAFLFTGAGTFAIFLTLSKQQEQFEVAQRQIETQQFETTFFNMLVQLFSIKNTASIEIDSKVFSGQEFFKYVLLSLKEKYDNNLNSIEDIKRTLESIKKSEKISHSKITMLRDNLSDIYVETYNQFYSYLGHYFRFFYTMFGFVIDNRANEKFKDADKYIQLLKAQLSNDEMGLIFCHTISDKVLGDDFNAYSNIETYGILENIDTNSLLNRSLHIIYPKTVFKFLNNTEKDLKSTSL